MELRVEIADDQPLVRAGLRMILDAAADISVVAEAGDGIEAVEQARSARPDLVLMDIRMPLVDGIEATRRICALPVPPRVVVLTTFDLDDYIYGALRAGASGFLLKDVGPEQLVAAIHTVANGDALLAPQVTKRLIDAVARSQENASIPAEIDDLTKRELEIFMLVAQGLSNSEIANRLVLSNATVKTHVNRILTKLQLRDRVQAVVLAYETGIIQPGTHPPAEAHAKEGQP